MQESFGRWPQLCWQAVRRDWQKIIVWVIGLGLFSGAYVPAFKAISQGQGLRGMYLTMQNPAMIAMVGPTPIKHAANYTIGAMYANEMLLFCGLFAMIIAALHVISHTRQEEERGLTELVRSYQVGRQANALAIILETIVINGLLGLLTASVMVSFGVKSITLAGALLFGGALALAGILGASLALVCAQLMPTAAGATGTSLGIIGLLYLSRAGTDISHLQASWFNPMSWIYLTAPFTHNNWLPLWYSLGFSAILIIIAFILGSHRDMGAGFLPEFAGRAHAGITLRSIPGLSWRLNRGPLISWLLGFIVMGAAYGSIYGDLHTFITSNPLIKQVFTAANQSIEAAFTSTIMLVMLALVAIPPIMIMIKLFTEENRGHLDQLFATKISRGQLYWSTLGLALVTGLIGTVIATTSLGAVALHSLSHTTLTLTDFWAAGFNLFPSVLFILGLTSFLLGWYPRLSKISYVYLGYAFALNYFGKLLQLPDWFAKTAIQTWLPRLPIANFDGPTFITITLISIGLMIIGWIGYRHRDMVIGA
ncbi:tetronasin resistance protein [Lactobacillus sp. CBA3605]|uniref:ABC transporter permease n=1 Tax=Lactobacillus sp. CBA3605 TaxID=2099788 RepID=UPI000CFB6838|nr:tetronasin resistance protein [Lactobacillus sp. CBA3605]AVK62222.1 tetronasin resistance protein [Lactobacillus sp. CBA3605]